MFVDRRVLRARPSGGPRSPGACASRPIRGSGLPALSLMVLIAEPARNSTFWAIPLRFHVLEVEDQVALVERPARVIMVGLMPATGRVSASSEARHSAP